MNLKILDHLQSDNNISPRKCYQPSTVEYQEIKPTLNFEAQMFWLKNVLAHVYDYSKFSLWKLHWNNNLKPITLILMEIFSQRKFLEPLQGSQLNPSCWRCRWDWLYEIIPQITVPVCCLLMLFIGTQPRWAESLCWKTLGGELLLLFFCIMNCVNDCQTVA